MDTFLYNEVDVTLHDKLKNMIYLLDFENQKVLVEIKKITDQQHSLHLNKENASKIERLMQDLRKQSENIQSLKAEIHRQLQLNP